MTSSKFLSICKDFYHTITLPSFIIFWLEIAKLGGGGGGGGKMPPSLFRLAKSSVQIGLIFRLSEQLLVKNNMARGFDIYWF